MAQGKKKTLSDPSQAFNLIGKELVDIRNHKKKKTQQLPVKWKSDNHGKYLSISIIAQHIPVRITRDCKLVTITSRITDLPIKE